MADVIQVRRDVAIRRNKGEKWRRNTGETTGRRKNNNTLKILLVTMLDLIACDM